MLECLNVGVLYSWSVGVLKYWIVGALECLNVGVLKCWSVSSCHRRTSDVRDQGH